MLSFVIPTLNEAKTIERTLQCLSQFSGRHEIIVSDGNSSDGTIEICRRYADEVVVYDGEARQTIAMARNMGAAVAAGDFVVFMDADVVIHDIDEFFATAFAEFRRRPELVALTGRYRVFPEVSTWFDRWVFFSLGLQFALQNNVFHIGGAGGEFQMITAEAFRKVNGFDERLTASEDMDLFRRLSQIGRTRFVNRLTVWHTGRRAHAVGWPRLLLSWFSNSMSVLFLRRSTSKEWTPVR
ncbi:glycosyltransferase family 2 protein [Mycolicibacterium sp. J2]|uniref:glycosyltransferase family 2 protein n=1 Tax=Mycolicibacterium sp. J2 TaxID=2993511 RepID=UPI00224B2E10|nr:glycosyltransferase [Mycolicibacterium sp. J2]MCX2713508.1 glycosyltransferase [Mycolicibacterium sp. J2]